MLSSKFLKRFLFDAVIILIAVISFSPIYSNHGDLAEAEDFVVDPVTGVSYPYTKTFTISAYYSPLPCQDRYATGNYESDIRLNGNGTNGADGTPVYAGMIAAPKTYGFGTKMYIPGIGITAVHDRGGAIVTAAHTGSYDRLDVWMGYGDQGLKRALQWGKRNVEVTVYGINDSLSEQIGLEGFSANESIPKPCMFTDVNETKVEETPTDPVIPATVEAEPTPSTPPVNASVNDSGRLSVGASGESVSKLQQELTSLNFYKGPITGYYGDLTEHAVFKFQQSQSLVSDKNSLGAGVFGPKTRDRVNEIVASRNYRSEIVVKNASTGKEKRIFLTELDFGMTGEDVKNLQAFLKEQGYFGSPFVTDYFGPVTQKAVLDFQLANGIVSQASDLGAGRVGQATLAAINSLS